MPYRIIDQHDGSSALLFGRSVAAAAASVAPAPSLLLLRYPMKGTGKVGNF